MQRINYWIRLFFNFSKTEANGFLILLPLMGLLIFSEPLYRKFIFHPSVQDYEKENSLDSLVVHWKKFDIINKKKTTRLFRFNPNTISKKKLESLGLRPYLAQRILNYRTKGGKFFIPSDMLKLYGIDSVWYNRVQPFITIPPIAKPKFTYQKKAAPKKKYYKNIKPFDLNNMDTTALKSIVGIGSILANRIAAYRNRLGGFVNKEQLYEVYGLDSSVVVTLATRTLIFPDYVPKKINLNSYARELASHPYISSKLATTIVSYRFQHGDFNSVESLEKIHAIKPAILEKMKPYLKIQP